MKPLHQPQQLADQLLRASSPTAIADHLARLSPDRWAEVERIWIGAASGMGYDLADLL